jgi:hypothetical protein
VSHGINSSREDLRSRMSLGSGATAAKVSSLPRASSGRTLQHLPVPNNEGNTQSLKLGCHWMSKPQLVADRGDLQAARYYPDCAAINIRGGGREWSRPEPLQGWYATCKSVHSPAALDPLKYSGP